MRSLVIGAGEVGSALASVLKCDLRDIQPSEGLAPTYGILHICFRFSPTFVRDVHQYTDSYGANLVIVHSTVPVGTCDPEGWVHSPVRGRHPDLRGGLTEFVKHFGGARAEEAAAYWPGSLSSLLHDLAATTEAAKLFELQMYGVEIAMEKEVHAFCQQNDLPFQEVYTQFASTYNAGWRRLGQSQFGKPILDHVLGPIGGHCVMPAMDLLPSVMGEYVRKVAE